MELGCHDNSILRLLTMSLQCNADCGKIIDYLDVGGSFGGEDSRLERAAMPDVGGVSDELLMPRKEAD